MHPLKAICLLSWMLLIASQIGLLWSAANIGYPWILLLVLPLLIPLKGLYTERRYTYKWIGFMAMLYFCIGISELFSNPLLRFYGLLTSISSILLFLASIYFVRYLTLQQHRQG